MPSIVTRVQCIVHCVLPDVGRHSLARVGLGKLADKRAILLRWNSSLIVYRENAEESKADDTIDGARTSPDNDEHR